MTALGSLLCRIGRHRPEPGARWNRGYAFTRCARCGRDLVRSMIGDWQAPVGHRVVWRAEALAASEPPSDPQPPSEPEPEPEPPPPRPSLTGRPLTAGTPSPEDKPSPFDFSDFDADAAGSGVGTRAAGRADASLGASRTRRG